MNPSLSFSSEFLQAIPRVFVVHSLSILYEKLLQYI